jgi:hypothetical protein
MTPNRRAPQRTSVEIPIAALHLQTKRPARRTRDYTTGTVCEAKHFSAARHDRFG